MAMTKPHHITISQRLDRYRAMAEVARREASRTAGEARDSYLFLADQWERLAEMAQKLATPPTSSFG
jgi:hypothetical protein